MGNKMAGSDFCGKGKSQSWTSWESLRHSSTGWGYMIWILFLLKFVCWSPKFWYLRMWSYMETVFIEGIRLKFIRWALIRYGWCPQTKRTLGADKPIGRTSPSQGEPWRKQPYQHLGFGLVASGTVTVRFRCFSQSVWHFVRATLE